MHRLFFISFFLLVTGCSSEPTSTGITIDLFDTEAFLAAEFDGVKQRNITKTISYNGTEEIIDIKDYNLSGDIKVLNQTNINNPSWTDKYAVDTLDQNNGRVDIVYTSVDPKLKIRKLIVSRERDRIIGFESYQEHKALISSSTKRISYTSDEGYQIATTSKNLISQERRVTIDVRF